VNIRILSSSMIVGICTFALGSMVSQFLWTVKAQPATTWQARQYCLSRTMATGKQALTACPTGFHMANMAEIINTSALMYATSVGYTLADSGSGPPFSTEGWVRTGENATNGSLTVPLSYTGGGIGNCNVWTSDAATMTGTSVFLAPEWASYAGQSTTAIPATQNFLGFPSLIAPWVSPYSIPTAPNQTSMRATCNVQRRVWCVQT